MDEVARSHEPASTVFPGETLGTGRAPIVTFRVYFGWPTGRFPDRRPRTNAATEVAIPRTPAPMPAIARVSDDATRSDRAVAIASAWMARSSARFALAETEAGASTMSLEHFVHRYSANRPREGEQVAAGLGWNDVGGVTPRHAEP
ncbi:MAG: hypothetical protein EBY11_05255 [Proteobacteria bacterium]|nr:hypothetical protein [Pseudomonadota bacterium]